MRPGDYLAKPVDLRGLLARIKAVLRRTDRAAAEDESEPPEGTRLARFGRFTLNLDSHKLFDTSGGEIPLTGLEFDLLKAFADNPNRVLTPHQLPNLQPNPTGPPPHRPTPLPPPPPP